MRAPSTLSGVEDKLGGGRLLGRNRKAIDDFARGRPSSAVSGIRPWKAEVACAAARETGQLLQGVRGRAEKLLLRSKRRRGFPCGLLPQPAGGGSVVACNAGTRWEAWLSGIVLPPTPTPTEGRGATSPSLLSR